MGFVAAWLLGLMICVILPTMIKASPLPQPCQGVQCTPNPDPLKCNKGQSVDCCDSYHCNDGQGGQYTVHGSSSGGGGGNSFSFSRSMGTSDFSSGFPNFQSMNLPGFGGFPSFGGFGF